MTYPTLDRTIPSEERWWHSSAMLAHNKNGRDGQQQTHERMADDFEPPEDDFDAWLYLAWIMQARALEMGCSWFRAIQPWCGGALYWQWNDCWPVSSWAAIDGDGRPKPVFYATRRFFAPRFATIKPARPVSEQEPEPPLEAMFHNDTAEPWRPNATLQRVRPDGTAIESLSETLAIAPRGVARWPLPGSWHEDPHTAVRVSADEAQGWWWFLPDKRIRYVEPALDAELTVTEAGYRLAITARTLIRDLCVFADRLDPEARVDDQAVSLLPGETAVFGITTERSMTKDALTQRPVLWSANAFGVS